MKAGGEPPWTSFGSTKDVGTTDAMSDGVNSEYGEIASSSNSSAQTERDPLTRDENE
jgi:hypothetical protein